jgi:hypothetical protein
MASDLARGHNLPGGGGAPRPALLAYETRGFWSNSVAGPRAGASYRWRMTPSEAGAPAIGSRYRCTACGNLTRFDVVSTRRTRSFHHYSIGGELVVEDEEVLSEVVEKVSCRWCESARAVEVIGEEGAG